MAENDHRLPSPIEIPGPTSPQSSLLAGRQRYLLFPRFTLESGVELTNVPVAFKTWGTLAATKDNALVVCHALTGSADVEDWWGPLLGKDKVFDYSRFFVLCCNVLGSPYGSASSCTQAGGESGWAEATQTGVAEALARSKMEWKGEGWWGPEFPATTVRDDVRIQKLVLEYLGVESIAAVVGGSMGGMAVLEWPLVFPTRYPGQASSTQRYIQAIVPLATSARHSAWCISWAEAQRQSIYSDPLFKHGYYEPGQPPRNGLSAARMAALLTYRSRDSFESRFGRRVGKALKGGGAAPQQGLPGKKEEETAKRADEQRRSSIAEDAAAAHNEGNLSPRVRPYGSNTSPNGTTRNGYFGATADTNSNGASANGPSLSPTATTPPVPSTPHPPTELSDEAVVPTTSLPPASAPATRLIEPFSPSTAPQIFSAQSYLRYQGDKFVNRFDANCYIHLTRKMDSHDVARDRWGWSLSPLSRSAGVKPETADEEDEALMNVLSFLSAPSIPGKPDAPAVLVVSIESDGLFAPPEQVLIHKLVEGSRFVSVKSTDGHDGFLLEFEQINQSVGSFLREVLGELYKRDPVEIGAAVEEVKESVFGEVEDVTRW
ncbi:Alpha/beta hydrolase fold-1 [Kalmanozyma brasiliensis GHG001]|uniref:AB hydrolase-1 domain-containing protein n=1 Tax=Kalmanozyma brasiliensis (strain GHG001) TaxID=1365824 RepID=V5F242_KALBG|nr:Alpha/beta hydrolase fold-1 [Kalmanozyma brasiliensis GHG001]EST09439.1 Alpha/beta hydrolase fold-1 [Kalmanozyma brasiliensis GHG001]